MEDDLNATQAVGALFDLAREINRGRDEGRPVEEAQATLRELAGVLGLTLAEEETGVTARPFIDLLVDDPRRAARGQALRAVGQYPHPTGGAGHRLGGRVGRDALAAAGLEGPLAGDIWLDFSVSDAILRVASPL